MKKGRKASALLETKPIATIRNYGCNVVLGNKTVVDISKKPKNNDTVARSKRRYFYPATKNWVTYQRARGLLNNKGIDLFSIPENVLERKAA
tara:strand:- start:62 stop:337 length:276 start_codon:yes stop_codon:yes gene_type:complete